MSNRTGSFQNHSKDGRMLANRTSEESPLGAEDATCDHHVRNPHTAPGQLPAHERGVTPRDADETYGDTEMPRDIRSERDRRPARHKKHPKKPAK
jgi:hypothetical protein